MNTPTMRAPVVPNYTGELPPQPPQPPVGGGLDFFARILLRFSRVTRTD